MYIIIINILVYDLYLSAVHFIIILYVNIYLFILIKKKEKLGLILFLFPFPSPSSLLTQCLDEIVFEDFNSLQVLKVLRTSKVYIDPGSCHIWQYLY